MAGAESDLARFIEPVARALLGDPNAHLSSKTELRFGHHGSLSIDLQKGTAYSHEDAAGGGVLWLIEREKGLKGKEAFEFLTEIGCEVETKPNGHHREPERQRRVVAKYDYVDEGGELLFQVLRWEPKTFTQRRPDPTDPSGWSSKVRGVRQVPYRLPELMEAISNERTVFIVEGEKDAGNLAKWNIAATCNAGGCGKWNDELTEFFRDADVVLIPDNDPQARHDKTQELRWYPEDHAEFPKEPVHPGQDHMEMVARRLDGVARSLRVLTLPGLPSKGDVTDWINAGGTAGELWALVGQTALWTRRTAPVSSRFGGMRWEEIGAPGSPKYEWIIEDIIPKAETVLIFGDSGTGKSFQTFDMAMCIARGLPFYGRNVEPGLVIYVAAEAGKGFSKRKIAYAVHHQLGQGPLPFYLMTKRPDFFGSDTDIDALIAEIAAIVKMYNVPLAMIVLDTLSALTPGMNENASADVSKVRARLQKLVDAFNVATVLVHHKPKGGSTPRGHGSLTGDFETTIEFTTTEIKNADGLPVHRATGQKQREGKKGQTWEFVLPVVQVGINKWGNPETSCVVIPHSGERAVFVNGFRANKTEIGFLEALFECLNDHNLPPPAGLPPSITRAAPLGAVRDKMRERYINSVEDSTKADNRFRQAFKRAGDTLKAGKVIGYRDPLVWYTGKPVHGLTATLAPVQVD